jgi:formylglycine-generating enzyme required for sulfatase activity
VVTIEYSDEPVLERYEFEVATLRMAENLLELQDVFKIANEAMKAHVREELSALQQEIIAGAWQRKGYAEIADKEGLSTGHVSKIGAALFRSLSQELRKTITKKNMVAVFSQLAGKPTKAELEIVRVRGAAEQFVELLGVGDALSLSQGVEIAMVRIPAGEFMMGSLSAELESQDNEKPQHLVKVPEFYFGKYPVTQAQWRPIANLSAINQELNPDPSTFKGDSLPVETVSWLDVIEFCARLSRYTGREYVLPSEAEWEYACRANTVTPFHFGETFDPQVANYNGGYVYGRGQKGIDRSKTIPVGSLNAANEYGLHDMHGNVWEWCQDHWHNNYQGAPENGSAWIDTNADEGNYKVLRGGSWDSNPSYCRSAARSLDYPESRDDSVGFRVVSRAMTS